MHAHKSLFACVQLYIQEAALDKARHENEMRTYIPAEMLPPFMTDGMGARQPYASRPRKKRKKRDPNRLVYTMHLVVIDKRCDCLRPKKAATPYTCFVKAKRKEVAEQLGDKRPATDVLKTVARLWREMDHRDKEPYEKEAESDKLRWTTALYN